MTATVAFLFCMVFSGLALVELISGPAVSIGAEGS
jgi:hypothetical protein